MIIKPCRLFLTITLRIRSGLSKADLWFLLARYVWKFFSVLDAFNLAGEPKVNPVKIREGLVVHDRVELVNQGRDVDVRIDMEPTYESDHRWNVAIVAENCSHGHVHLVLVELCLQLPVAWVAMEQLEIHVLVLGKELSGFKK